MPRQLIDPATGALRDVPDENIAGALAAGWHAETPEDTYRLGSKAADELNYGGVAGGIKAGLAGIARGATLGASDVAARIAGGEDTARTLEGLQAQNPITSGAGEFAGMILPAVVTGGAATPAGIAAKIGRGVTAGFTREGAGVIGRAAGHAIGAAAEGALYGGGQYLSQAALENKPLSAEGFVGGMGKGALFAAPVGGGFSLAGDALVRARSLFPRSQITTEAAAAAKNDATTALNESLADGDAMAQAARQQIAIADAQAGAAGARTQVTRAVFGGGEPAALGAQAAATADKAQLVDALQQLEASQQSLKEWIASGGDVNFMSEPGVDRVVQSMLDRPDALGPGGVPVGEFGAPGKGGIKSPEELAAAAAGERSEPRFAGGTPQAAQPETRVLRGPGGPVEPAGPLDAIGAEPASEPAAAAIGGPAQLDDIRPAGGPAADSTRVLKGAGAPEPSPLDAIGASEQPGTAVGRRPAIPSEPSKPLSDEEFQSFKREYGHAASGKQFDAEMYYSKGGDGVLNGALREGKPLEGKAAEHYQQLMDAYKLPESRLQSDTTLYRGLTSKDAEARYANLKPGDVVEDPGFTSTAYSDKAKSRNEQVVFTISAPAGTPGLPIRSQYHGEGEILLPPGTRMRVDKIEYVPISDRWDMSDLERHEVLPDKSVQSTKYGKTWTTPPIKDIHVSIVSEHAPVTTVRPPRVGLDAPIDQLSLRQIGQYQDALSAAMEKAGRGTPEYEALGKKWDETVERRNAIEDGKIENPTIEYGARAAEPASPGNAIPDHATVRAHENKFDDYLSNTVPARDIATRGYYEPPGGGTDAVRVENARKAIREGQREAIKLNVSPDGKITVTDGRHRLQAAIEADAPVKVKWSTGSEPAPSDVLRHGSTPSPHQIRNSDGTAVVKRSLGVREPPAKVPAGREIKNEAEFRALQQDLRSKLTPDEIKQSLRYSREYYLDINRHLRGDPKYAVLEDSEKPIIPALDSILAKSRISEPVVTHRAAGSSESTWWRNLKPGETVTDPGYVSTAWKSENIHRFGNAHFEITWPAGSELAAIPSSASEGELIGPRNTVLRITAREDLPGGRVRYAATAEPAAVGEAAQPGPFTPVERDAGGSQGGKWFRDASGAQWFGKAYRNPDRIEAENIASRLYRMFGVSAPETTVAEVGGKRMLMSKELPGREAGSPEALARTNAKDGFVIDAWLGNRDVVGANPTAGFDNMLIEGDRVHRIDQGGALIFKGTGGPKEFGREVTEFEGLRKPSRAAGQVFGSLTTGEVDKQLAAFARDYRARRAEIDALVDGSGLSADAKRQIKSGLHERAEWLIAKAPTSAGAQPAAAADDLLSALQGTKSALDRGENLVAMGAPARDAYRTARAAKGAADAERFRAAALAKRPIEGPVRAAPDTELERLLDGTKAALDSGASMREVAQVARHIGGAAEAPAARAAKVTTRLDPAELGLEFHPGTRTYHAPAAARAVTPEDEQITGLLSRPAAEREVGDATMARILAKHGLAEAPRPAGATPEPDALAARVLRNERRPVAVAPTAPVSDAEAAGRGKLAPPPTKAEIRDQQKFFREVGKQDSNTAIEQLFAKRIGKNVDMGPALARAAKVIGDHEAASANMADLLGEAAPKTAVTRAQALQAARQAQAEAQGASAAKAAQDVGDRAAPAMAGAAGGKLADVGTALEVMKALGVHVPALSAIPVIGPVLGAFFKARAVLSILGRKGGSIGRSVDGMVAQTAAATRDRIATATQAILTGAGKGAIRLSEASAGPAVTLGYKLFPGDGITKSKDPQKLYEARMDEIARAQQPGAIDHAIADRYQTSDPNLHDAIVGQVQRGIAFLDSKAPKPSIVQTMLPGDGVWRPSKAQLDEFGKYVHAVGDPASVLEDLAKGHVTLEGAETLRVVYPELFAEGQRLLLQAAPQMQKTLPYPTRVAISILYRIPVDGTMTPGHLQYLQGASQGAPPAGGPAGPGPGMPPGLTGPINLGKATMTTLDRRAGS